MGYAGGAGRIFPPTFSGIGGNNGGCGERDGDDRALDDRALSIATCRVRS